METGTAGGDPLRHFIGKWQAREPEMVLAEVFCKPAQRPLFRAWGACLHELREALFELSDERVTEIKLAWWAEELAGWGQGRHRHPLGAALPPADAPWSGLAQALLESGVRPALAANTGEAIAALRPLADAVVAVESALFSSGDRDDAAHSLAVHWLLQRLPAGLAAADRARIPMHLLARHGLTAAQLATGEGGALLRDWAGELLVAAPQPRTAALIRRSCAAFDRARLQQLAAGRGYKPAPALASLWRGWRAARER